MENFEGLYNSALRFLSYRTRSEKEVRDKLRTKNVEPEIIEKIVLKLKEKRFINDEEYARQWIENRNRFKPRSLRLIKMELKQKGLTPEIIKSAVKNQELGVDSDLEQAKKLAEKRIGRLRNLPKQKIYEKLGRYLASKGFNWDTVKKAIDDVLEKGV
jgi:regulatory protein